MPLDLDRLQQRIIGVLIEKELAVPDSYPLTLGVLVAGCNQKSNRDPQMSVEPYEVEGALHGLMDAEWVLRKEMAGARTVRYEHQAREQLGVEDLDLAILAELLCRGPQAPGALKTRIGRMHHADSPAAVEARLQEMAARPVPYVRRLERRPREHASRWEQLLGAGADDAETPAPMETPAVPAQPTAPRFTPPAPDRLPMDVPTTAPPPPVMRAAPPIPQASPVADPVPDPVVAPAAPAVPTGPTPEVLDLMDRVEALEQLVRDLTERLDRLEGR